MGGGGLTAPKPKAISSGGTSSPSTGGGGGGGSGTVTSVGTAGIATGGPISTTGTVTVAGSGNTEVAATAATNLAAAPAGDVLTADGNGNVEDSGVLLSSVVSGLVLLEEHTAADSAALNFTAWLSADFDEYLIECVNLVPDEDSNIILQVSVDGGVTYDGGSHYGWAAYRASSAGAANAGNNSDTLIQLDGGTEQTSTAANGGFCGTCRMFNPGSGAMYTRFRGDFTLDDGTANFCVAVMVAGAYAVAAIVNAFRIVADADSIMTSGTVRVYGFKK